MPIIGNGIPEREEEKKNSHFNVGNIIRHRKNKLQTNLQKVHLL